MHHGDLDENTALGLEELRRRIAKAGIPSSKLDESMSLATWNIREFGRRARKPAALHFIAEIIGQFDLVSVVELRDDTRQLEQVLRYLGPYWDVVFSDFLTDDGGNRERIGYVYDTRNVLFTGLASNTEPRRIKTAGEYTPIINWWRKPYLASFRSGNFDFVMLAAHIRWGDSEASREPELAALADWVADRLGETFVDDKDIIVVGDFNIPSEKSALFRAIKRRGLKVPDALLGVHGSNLQKAKRYDQILHLPEFTKAFTGRGGVLDFYCGDHKALFPGVQMAKEAFTYQVSDHLPLWVELNTDNDSELLDQMLGRRKKP